MTDELLEKFLADQASPKTQSTYRTGVKLFLQFEHSGEENDSLLVDYWRWLKKRKPAGQWARDTKRLSDQSVNAYIAAAIGWLEFLSDEGQLISQFSLDKAKSRLKKVRKSQRVAYPVKTVDPNLPKVIVHYDSIPLPAGETPKEARARLILLRNRAIMHVLYSSGGRISEVQSLYRNAIQKDRAIIVGKGRKERVLMFTREARQAIDAYLNERTDKSSALFVGHRLVGKLSRQSIWKVVKQAAAAEDVKNISPHSIRHFRARQMLREGAKLEQVQAYLGHDDIGTTRKVYAPFNDSEIEDAVKNFGLSPKEALEKVSGE